MHMEKISYAVDCILSPLATGTVESVSYFSANFIIKVNIFVYLYISAHVGSFLTIVAITLQILLVKNVDAKEI